MKLAVLKAMLWRLRCGRLRGRNGGYLRLNFRQELRHDALMSMEMSGWPSELSEHLRQHDKESFCGDALSCWVADWVRES